jgi:hypothetical protein
MKVILRDIYRMYTTKLRARNGRNFIITKRTVIQRRGEISEAYQHGIDGNTAWVLRPYIRDTITTLCIPFELTTLHNLIVGEADQFRVCDAPTCLEGCHCDYRNYQFSRTIRDTRISCHCIPDVSYEDATERE